MVLLFFYRKVASKRFADKTLQLLQLHFGKVLSDSLKDTLIPALMEKKDTLFSLSSADEEYRKALKEKIERLQLARDEMVKSRS
jgi:hypothetical protein